MDGVDASMRQQISQVNLYVSFSGEREGNLQPEQRAP